MSGQEAYRFKAATPLLRMFDADKTKEFYLGYLGLRLDWEHRYEPDMPLYMQVSAGDVAFHLTEHHGDCTPGSAVRVEVANLRAYYAELSAKTYGYARPGLERAFGCDEIRLTDPSGNRITLFERREEEDDDTES